MLGTLLCLHKTNKIMALKEDHIMQIVLADVAVSVSDLKKNPSGVLAGAGGMPVAVLNHNRVMGYIVPAELYEQMMDRLDDLELIEVVKARSGEKGIPVNLDDL